MNSKQAFLRHKVLTEYLFCPCQRQKFFPIKFADRTSHPPPPTLTHLQVLNGWSLISIGGTNIRILMSGNVKYSKCLLLVKLTYIILMNINKHRGLRKKWFQHTNQARRGDNVIFLLDIECFIQCSCLRFVFREVKTNIIEARMNVHLQYIYIALRSK